ncbi:MAG TPA: hypothetical protein VE545_04885 [Candidatus Dormibacteraeota bacterium]|nr:hypothetical protein [Candidatus Dormibacteraeota bacterium]
MRLFSRQFVKRHLQTAVALLACAALLYFACGGALLHTHTGGPETPCHVCQALHMPALASARLAASIVPEPVSWLSALPRRAALIDSFSLHRPSRAPPAV